MNTATYPPAVDRAARQTFRYINKLQLLNWRMGLGPYLSLWPSKLGQYLVLIHTGRKSGLQRRTPVNFAEIDGDIYVTAGFGHIADWYRNIMANPAIEVWLPTGWYSATAEDVSDAPNRLVLLREVLKGSGFASFAAGIDPYTITDDQLAEVAAAYRLLRIRPVAPRTGSGGPGDLLWLWPLTATVLLVLLVLVWLSRPRRTS